MSYCYVKRASYTILYHKAVFVKKYIYSYISMSKYENVRKDI